MEAVNYSVLLFYPELHTEVQEKINELLKQGIKVYFYTFDDIESLQSDPHCKGAMQVGFLRTDVVRYDAKWDVDPICICDGQVDNDEIFRWKLLF
ncbi:hypothetical protein EXW39_04735 [Bacillus mycoides]|uniref:hypothetical protein n=1 Tax=Bacillus mycoides TaxID=1405 RepID=UPI001C02C00B|nr:hypothetical protein [Bacillus mycoides]QWH59506.1 hypothetical protein EXW39_04735 [Bacillus mycoides]